MCRRWRQPLCLLYRPRSVAYPCSKWAPSGHSSSPQEAGRGTGDGRRRRLTAATARPREGPRCPSEIPSPPGLPTTFSLPPRYQMPYLRISLHVTRWTHRKTEKIVQKCNSRIVCPTRLVGKLANAGRHCGYLRCMWVDSSVWYPGGVTETGIGARLASGRAPVGATYRAKTGGLRRLCWLSPGFATFTAGVSERP